MEAVGQLAGGVAHDFNNLLTIIKGYSELMLIELDINDPMFKPVKEIEKAVSRAESLTGQLLAFSRKQVLQPKVLDINQVIAGMEKMLRRLIGEDILMVTNLDRGTGFIKADPGQMEQVVLNLAVNARDAMPGGGKLTVETGNARFDKPFTWEGQTIGAGAYVMLGVNDTGLGMTEETASHIFEPFFTTKREGEGTGLGLSTVYGIVRQSSGFINISSEPGIGTTFKLYFPRVEEAPDAVVKTGQTGESLQGNETILVVEDDGLVREMACKILIRNSYHVLEAADGREALAVCREYGEKIHLLLTDVIMPEMSGPKLVDRLNTLHPGMKVIYMSGHTEDARLKHGISEGDVEFIQKPFSINELLKKVREVLVSSVNYR
jgi:CheY-like chemotaxis protein